ncbi:MAG: hypothetical protein JNM27_15435 [Leptospirales bacterium]|nr:hypothetical protein [Leptospirales bacterium]
MDHTAVTAHLKDLIKQVQNSGRTAWEAGGMLKSVRDSRTFSPGYASFQAYTQQEFNMKERTAQSYIKIHESFLHDEVSPVMLFTHLRRLSEIDNGALRSRLIAAIREFERQHPTKDGSPPYTTEDIVALKNVVSQEEDLVSVATTFKSLVQSSFDARQERVIKLGNKLVTSRFPQLTNVFEYEPVSEMGLVGLFCVMFPLLKEYPFEFENLRGKKEDYFFDSIKFIQTAFPDTCFLIRNKRDNSRREIHAEFEHRSRNFVNHKHPHAECSLIVCWEDTVRSNPKRAQEKWARSLPPIFALKDFFTTGQISFRSS